jgi:hypothetical protein
MPLIDERDEHDEDEQKKPDIGHGRHGNNRSASAPF